MATRVPPVLLVGIGKKLFVFLEEGMSIKMVQLVSNEVNNPVFKIFCILVFFLENLATLIYLQRIACHKNAPYVCF